MNKRRIYFGVIIFLIVVLSVWQYQKYMNNKIPMNEKLQEIDKIIKKEDREIFKLVITDVIKQDTVEDIKTYTIQDKEEIEDFTALFDNLKETTLNTNKKGIEGTNYKYSLLFYFGYKSSDGEYTEDGRFYLYLNENRIHAFKLEFSGDSSRMELNGQLEKDSESFVNPFIDYIVNGINNNRFLEK